MVRVAIIRKPHNLLQIPIFVLPTIKLFDTSPGFNAGISACGKAGEWILALQLLSDMPAAVEPNVITYSAAISACASAGQWRAAVCLLENMLLRGIAPTVISFNAAISSCEAAGFWQLALPASDKHAFGLRVARCRQLQRMHQYM